MVLRSRLLGSTFLEGPATDFEISLTSSIGSHIVNEALYNELSGTISGLCFVEWTGRRNGPGGGYRRFDAGWAHQSRSRRPSQFLA